MAGIGVKLNRIFEKNTLSTTLVGFGYSAVVTIAPMFLVIGEIVLASLVLGFSEQGYAERELYSCTVLYMFIFSMIVTAPLNSVLSRYMSDVIYEEKYEDILPCFYMGLFLVTVFGCILGIPFCIHEAIVGQVDVLYVLVGFCGYIACIFVFYSMLYLSITKDYKKISWFFFVGMLVAFLLSLLFVNVFGMGVTDAMLLSLTIGFALIACEEFATIKRYFRHTSGNYRPIFRAMRKYWKLIVSNTMYILGLYVHNFVFWTTDIKMIVVDSFVCAPSYDLASCIAMFTNISMTVILISRLEMHFREKYKAYSESVIGGRGIDIVTAKNQMFRQLSAELMNLVRIQFMISVVVFLLFSIFLPMYGYSGMVMQIYPCLAAGYFILFLMYSAIIFLYYFNDLNGAMATAISFFVGTVICSIIATGFSERWYGVGVVIGSLIGWSVAYFRLRWVERHMDEHIFCNGTILPTGKGEMPPSKVYEVD